MRLNQTLKEGAEQVYEWFEEEYLGPIMHSSWPQTTFEQHMPCGGSTGRGQ